MNKTGLILFHGFFEHKERHRLNAEWFENLGIKTHLVDLPGHGEGAVEKGDLESWSEIDRTCLLYTSPSPRDISGSRMPSSA